MRSVVSSLLLLCTLALPVAAQVPEALRASRPAKHEGAGLPKVRTTSGVLGDDFSDPFVISSLPYSDVGNTCTFLNNVQGSCGGTGPDVVYAFTPAQNVTVTISLCDPSTNFDTVLDLYQNSSATLVSCSDDVCGLQSEIPDVTLFAGNTYYVVVDGLGGACGDYRLSLTPTSAACNVTCPPSATAEGEPLCGDGSVDKFNGGCNSSPISWSDVPCSPSPVTICGHYGNFITAGLEYKDTDWYRVVAGQPTTLVATVDGEINTMIAILDISGGCNNIQTPGPILYADPCTPTTCSATVPAGAYFVFVAPANSTGSPCSANYTLTVSGTACTTGVKTRTWGSLKAMYR
jgi:hypothetical protein